MLIDCGITLNRVHVTPGSKVLTSINYSIQTLDYPLLRPYVVTQKQ